MYNTLALLQYYKAMLIFEMVYGVVMSKDRRNIKKPIVCFMSVVVLYMVLIGTNPITAQADEGDNYLTGDYDINIYNCFNSDSNIPVNASHEYYLSNATVTVHFNHFVLAAGQRYARTFINIDTSDFSIVNNEYIGHQEVLDGQSVTINVPEGCVLRYRGINADESTLFVYVNFELIAYTPQAVLEPSYAEFLENRYNRIINAKPDETVILEMGTWDSLSLDFMQAIAKMRQSTFVIHFIYEGKNYEVVIPAGAEVELDTDIPWYGPLKLNAMFGMKELK